LKRYAEMAYASAKEVQSQLERARKTRMITQEEYAELAPQADRVAALCFGLSGM
jgi:four helix bundle protein